jgi:hypothetical protein
MKQINRKYYGPIFIFAHSTYYKISEIYAASKMFSFVQADLNKRKRAG